MPPDSRSVHVPLEIRVAPHNRPSATPGKRPSTKPKGSEKTAYIFGIFGMFTPPIPSANHALTQTARPMSPYCPTIPIRKRLVRRRVNNRGWPRRFSATRIPFPQAHSENRRGARHKSSPVQHPPRQKPSAPPVSARTLHAINRVWRKWQARPRSGNRRPCSWFHRDQERFRSPQPVTVHSTGLGVNS